LINGIFSPPNRVKSSSGLLGFVAMLAYCWFFWTRHDGQTPGKMLTGIRVIKTDGTKFSEVDVFIRVIGYWINSAVIGIGWLWALIDSDKQGWHDKLARTYVVKASSSQKRKNVNIG
jgi:uncharacterized RDD family membrane protein YckC